MFETMISLDKLFSTVIEKLLFHIKILLIDISTILCIYKEDSSYNLGQHIYWNDVQYEISRKLNWALLSEVRAFVDLQMLCVLKEQFDMSM